MTRDEAENRLAACPGYVDLDLAGCADDPMVLDGHFTAEELEAIVFLKRDSI